jgi:single-stranded DNA-binding protein
VNYSDPDGDPPEQIMVVINNIQNNMSFKSGDNQTEAVYEYQTRLPEGTSNYYFKASDGSNITFLNDTGTGNFKLTVLEAQNRQDRDPSYFILLSIIIMTGLILTILIGYLRGIKTSKGKTSKIEQNIPEITEDRSDIIEDNSKTR